MDETKEILNAIEEEIEFLKKYQWNLKKTAISNDNKLSYYKNKSYKILDEVDRVTLEINNLERQKLNFLIN